MLGVTRAPMRTKRNAPDRSTSSASGQGRLQLHRDVRGEVKEDTHPAPWERDRGLRLPRRRFLALGAKPAPVGGDPRLI